MSRKINGNSRRNHKKSNQPLSLFNIFNYTLMTLLGLIMIFPFYYVVLISLADYASVQKQVIYIFPTVIDFSSYKLVFGEKLFLNSMLISFFVATVGTIYSMLISSMAAYALSKKIIPGHKIMFGIAIIPMFFSGGLIPYYLTIMKLGLINNIMVLIIPSAITTFYLILLKNSFDDIPQSIEESAKIDGANDMLIFFRIVLPTSVPVIATIALFYAVDKWNEYYNALLFISDPNKYPLQLVLREVVQNFTALLGTNIGQEIAKSAKDTYTKSLQMAIIVTATIPIIIVYPMLQKYFTKGIMLGAIKE